METDGKVILLDLNYTLVANSDELGFPQYKNLNREEYRRDLVDRIRSCYVILITVRPAEYREATLKRIKRRLFWLPHEALFNDWRNLKAPQVKQSMLEKYVFPTHGREPEKYFAIESNQHTRAMYAKLGITALHYLEFMGIGPAPGHKAPKLIRSKEGR